MNFALTVFMSKCDGIIIIRVIIIVHYLLMPIFLRSKGHLVFHLFKLGQSLQNVLILKFLVRSQDSFPRLDVDHRQNLNRKKCYFFLLQKILMKKLTFKACLELQLLLFCMPLCFLLCFLFSLTRARTFIWTW